MEAPRHPHLSPFPAWRSTRLALGLKDETRDNEVWPGALYRTRNALRWRASTRADDRSSLPVGPYDWAVPTPGDPYAIEPSVPPFVAPLPPAIRLPPPIRVPPSVPPPPSLAATSCPSAPTPCSRPLEGYSKRSPSMIAWSGSGGRPGGLVRSGDSPRRDGDRKSDIRSDHRPRGASPAPRGLSMCRGIQRGVGAVWRSAVKGTPHRDAPP